jgi:hypothetical protein
MKAIGFFYGAGRYGSHRETLFDFIRPTTISRDILSPHPEEQPSGCVSKDAPDGSGASWNILRDAILRIAPQDEGLWDKKVTVGGRANH